MATLPITSHRQLIVWQKSMDLVSAVYRASKTFPPEEKFGLTSQIKRAAISVPSNIAEGRIRKGTKEFIQFLHIALGSTAELDTQFEIARREGFLKQAYYDSLMSALEEVGKMLTGLISSLNAKR
ncbi:MAG TPA: four helix bundle protein [Candidatus Paceibacterota bacterium]